MEGIHPLGVRGNVEAPRKESSQATMLEAISDLLAADLVFYAPREWCLCNTVLWAAQSLTAHRACSVCRTLEPFGDASLAVLVPALTGKPHRLDHGLLASRTFRVLYRLEVRSEELLRRGEGLKGHLCELRG